MQPPWRNQVDAKGLRDGSDPMCGLYRTRRGYGGRQPLATQRNELMKPGPARSQIQGSEAWCPSCKQWKSLNLFHPRNDRKIIEGWCKLCRRAKRVGLRPVQHNRTRRRDLVKEKARAVYYHAIRTGKLVRPQSCEKCWSTGKKIHGHHYKGYQKENALEVQWLCPPCHVTAHCGY
jgi:hypothetical protein